MKAIVPAFHVSKALVESKVCNVDQSRLITDYYQQLMRSSLRRLGHHYVSQVELDSNVMGSSRAQRSHEISLLSNELEKLQTAEIVKWNSYTESLQKEVVSLETKCENKLAQTVHDALLDLAREKVHFREGHVAQTMAVQDLFTQIDTETQSMQGNIDKLLGNMFFSVTSVLGMTTGFIVAYMRFISG